MGQGLNKAKVPGVQRLREKGGEGRRKEKEKGKKRMRGKKAQGKRKEVKNREEEGREVRTWRNKANSSPRFWKGGCCFNSSRELEPG